MTFSTNKSSVKKGMRQKLSLVITGTTIAVASFGVFSSSVSAQAYLNGNDPDVILYKDPNLRGQSLNVNASPGYRISNVGTSQGDGTGFSTTFNDTVSSIRVIRGDWVFAQDTNMRGDTTGILKPGVYNLGHNDDKISSMQRVGN